MKNFQNVFNFLDLGDFKYFYLVAKKNFKNLILLSSLIALIVFFISLNLTKKFMSNATLVISPEENKIVNIEEVYSIESMQNRVNNQIAILKSEEVIDYILEDNKNELEFKNLYSSIEQSTINRILSKKPVINKDYLKQILRENFEVNNLPRSDVLKLSFVSDDPKISQLALRNIIDSYQRYEIDSKIQITNYANTKITERLKDLTKQMDEADNKLAQYKRENDLIDTGNVKELKIKEIQSISNRILDAKENKQLQQNDLLAIKVAEGDVDALLAIKI